MPVLILPALSNVQAQIPDTISLKTVEVMGSRATVFTGGISTVLTDSTKLTPFQNQSLAELLSTNSAVFIKTYGSGGSATISSRGTEARHSAILWNGFNLNSASLGLTDLSMIPVFLTDKISLMHGGSSPVNGNSAIGSTVLMENSLGQFNGINSTAIIAEGGNFGNVRTAVNMIWSNRFMESKTSVFYDGAKNNFTYTDLTRRDKPEATQQNAAYDNYGLVQDFQFKLNSNNFLSAGLWYQVTDRELAPLMTNPQSKANQRDSTWRTFIGYKLVLKKSVLSVKGAYFREFQYYEDAKFEIDNKYLVNNYFGEAEWRYFLSEKLVINSGITYNMGEASFKEYSGSQIRSTAALFSDIRYSFAKGWQASVNLRQEFSNIAAPPFSPSFALEGIILKNYISVLAKVGRNYNLPSLNDLYWIPGGNPDLLPEDAWGEEISLLFFKNHKNLPTVTFTAFNSVVHNWIKWQPSAGGIYAPNNLRQVHSRGLESALDYRKNLRNWTLGASIHYTWSKSSISETNVQDETATLDKQLMYVPEHMFNANFSVAWKSVSLFISNSYVGERFTTSDNTSKLDDFYTADMSVEKSFVKLRIPFSCYVKIYNLTDASYQVMAYRPMPGRWYSAGIKINFNLPNKS